MHAFPAEVIRELGTYVYRLIDPRNGETYYVGKGKANRVFSHARGEVEETADILSDKLVKIREIRLAGLDVQHVIHRHGMDDATAFEVEAALIEAYPGVTNIAGGHGNADRGTVHALEIVHRYSAADAILDEALVEILVPRTSKELALYDATRFAWKLSRARAERAKFVLAATNGLVVGVFKPHNWLPASPENFPTLCQEPIHGRFGFIGEVASIEVQEKYLHKKLPLRPRGAANPIRYHGC